MRCSAGHALQVQVLVAQLAAIQSQGFQNGKWHAHPFKKCPFGGPFAPFAGGVGIGGDAAANAAAHGAGTLHHQRANGHVEGGAHATRAVAAHHACSAAIPAARFALQRGNGGHAAALGRTGDGAAGKQRLKNRFQRGALGQLGPHIRSHLPDAGQRLQLKQRRHADAADLRDAAQVVAQQIDNHHVLGPLFGAAAQVLGLGRVVRRGGAPGGGAFHGAGENAAAALGGLVPVKK